MVRVGKGCISTLVICKCLPRGIGFDDIKVAELKGLWRMTDLWPGTVRAQERPLVKV